MANKGQPKVIEFSAQKLKPVTSALQQQRAEKGIQNEPTTNGGQPTGPI